MTAQRVIVKTGPKHLKKWKKEQVEQRRLWLCAECCTSNKIEEVAVCGWVTNKRVKDMQIFSMLVGGKKGNPNNTLQHITEQEGQTRFGLCLCYKNNTVKVEIIEREHDKAKHL